MLKGSREAATDGRMMQVRRKRLGLKSSDVAAMLLEDVQNINAVENAKPYVSAGDLIYRLHYLYKRFEDATITDLIRDYVRSEAENHPHSDYEYELGDELAAKNRACILAHYKILQQLKRIKVPPMGEQLYVITFKDGTTQEEYGKSEADVRDFIQRCFKFRGEVQSVTLYQP